MKTELLHIFMIDFTKGWGVREHVHDFYQIWYVVDGAAAYLLDREFVQLSKGDIVFLPPGTPHELPVVHEGLLRYVDIKFAIADEELRRKVDTLPRIIHGEDSYVTGLVMKCREMWYKPGSYSREIAMLTFEQALLEILRQQEGDDKGSGLFRPVPPVDIRHLTGIAAEIVAYLDTHYAEEFDLDSLANIFRYNKAYLCSRFKKATGITITGYLNYIRISKAYELICYTANSISNIGLMMGFSSIHYFTRTFKKICGVPPSRVREIQKDRILRDTLLHGNFNYRYYVDLQSQKSQLQAQEPQDT